MARFDDTVREYTSHLRWGHFREITNYMTDAYRPAAQDKISSLKNIRISRVRSSDWQASDETGNRLTGMVEIHYYASDHAIVRETQQQLVWLYDEEAKFWQLDSGLPDLLAE